MKLKTLLPILLPVLWLAVLATSVQVIYARHQARALIDCKKWPGDDATGAEAAQLALLRLLWL